MPEFTQEQLDALISEKISEAKKGLFSEEELNKRVTSEVDRRVESGIQKGIETHKKKWEEEYSQRAKLTAEELAQKELEDKLAQLNSKEKEILLKSNKIDAIYKLSEANVPKSHYDNFIGMLVTDNAESTSANIENFINMYKSTRTDIETKIKEQFSTIPAPTKANNGEITKEKFDKMGYAEKIKFKSENPELYKQFIK